MRMSTQQHIKTYEGSATLSSSRRKLKVVLALTSSGRRTHSRLSQSMGGGAVSAADVTNTTRLGFAAFSGSSSRCVRYQCPK